MAETHPSLDKALFDILEEARFPESIDHLVEAVKAQYPGTDLRVELTYAGTKYCSGPKSILGTTPPLAIDTKQGKVTWYHVTTQVRKGEQEAISEAIRRLINVLLHLESRMGTDWLTQLPNRLALEHFKEHRDIERWRWVALLDIDQLKSVNDKEGYLEGDACVKQVAEALDASMGGRGILFRIGGDEFLGVLESPSSGQVLEILADLSKSIPPGRSVSIGATPLGKSFEDSLALAEKALQKAKQSGPASIEVFTHS